MPPISANEVEVKIAIADRAAVRQRIEAIGFSVAVPRDFEANTLYDNAGRTLRQSEILLRLRQIGSKSVITWKGPPEPGRHKNRLEIETTLGSIEKMDQILRRLDYQPVFRYEKYRTEFAQPDQPGSVITVDETPIGDFLELEGPADWIDSTAQRLGFSQQDYVLESYAHLYFAFCDARGVEPGNMVFAP